ncbi:MAG TPA: ABC transporter ATP-binding protein, partial [Leptospiraceae bacterium]|nr:ABC transporter ATP-binding protein [Leptospiraceae bacterium]
QASVIVFDEATSALDNETEQAVMEAIEGLGKDLTILMIAHRLSTVKNCDQVIELGAGQIRRAGKYEELFAAHN